MIMNNSKPTVLKLTVLLAVVFLVVPTWNHNRTVLALSPEEKRCLLDETKVALEPKDELVKSISNLTDGVYSFELSTVRTGCATSGNGRNDYLGFNNRTCTTSLAPKKTAGPVMRQSNKSKQWYDWLLRVEGSEQQDDGSIEVSLQAFIDPKLAEDAYCLGFMSTFYDSPGYNAVCSLPPYGTGMFMNGSVSCPVGQDTDAQKWLIRPVGDSGEVEILAPKPAICARAVAVKDCEYQPILVNYPVVNEANTNTYAKWKLIKLYDLVPRTIPSPPPLSPPPTLGPIPGPIISAPTSTSSGSLNVLVSDLGGNSRCQVTSIEIFAMGSPVGSVPEMVEVSASTPALSTAGVPILLPYAGYNSLYAYSVCSTGEKTVMSNQLTVFYVKPLSFLKAVTIAVTSTTWTAGWESAGLGSTSVEFKCVLPGQACTAQSQGTPFVDPTGNAKQGTVSDLYSSTSYYCYVIADQKVAINEVCSEPVRITTLGLPTFVFTSSVANIPDRRKLMLDPVFSTDRCIVGTNGNFTSCVSAGLVDTFIFDGVVSPQKRWLSYFGATWGDSFVYTNITTCRLGPFGELILPRCDVSYSAPPGYELITTVFDPLGRRVWFSLSPVEGARSAPTSRGSMRESLPMNNVVQRMKERQEKDSLVATIQTAPDEYFGTCAVDAQGVYSGCTQSAAVPTAILVGPGWDTTGFYARHSTTDALEFCGNDMSFPCSPVSGVSPSLRVFHLRFLTSTQAYVSANNDSNNGVSIRCDVDNAITFSNCQTVLDENDRDVVLLNPANNGANAYTYTTDFFTWTYSVCSVAASTGFFENCTTVSDALPARITSPAFSSPIAF